MKENIAKQILKKSVALTIALLIAFSATWTGFSTVTLAADETEPEVHVEADGTAPAADDNDIIPGTTIKVKVKGTNITYLKFIPTYTGNYQFYSSADTDTYGYLYDVEKNQLASNDDGGDENNFSITYRLVAGQTYYWGVKYYQNNTGTFNVTLLCLSCSHNNKTPLEAKAPTCTQFGYTATEFCNDCNGFVSPEVIIPNTHIEANGKAVATVEATCTSYGYTEGVWCDECNAWISGYEKIVLSHLDENNDNSCDRCSNTMPVYSSRHTDNDGDVSCNLYEDGTLEFFGEGSFYFGDFSYPSSLVKKIIISEGITELRGNGLSNVNNLKSVYFPSSLVRVNGSVFEGCTSLEKVYAHDVKSWVNIDFAYSNSNPMYYAEELYFGSELATEIIIPEGVTTIGDYVFYNCKSLANITIPKGVTTIGSYAFSRCHSLTNITIPDSVTSIAEGAFNYCESLKSVYASDVESWLRIRCEDKSASPMCYATELYFNGVLVTDVIVPNTITAINNYAFRNCASLKSVIIPDSVKSIGNSAFYNCVNLETANIPNGVTSIGNDAFGYCGKLTDVVIPDSVEKIGSSAFSRCHSLTNIIIPDSVTTMLQYAFYNCDSLKSVKIGNGITTVYYQTFESCEKLKDITIGSNIKIIEESAFQCDALTRITIPDNVTSIDSDAFYSDAVIYCKTGSYAASWAEENGNPFVLTDGTDEESIFTGKCGTGVTYTFDKRTGVLEIKGSGEIASFSQTKSPWYDNRCFITKVIIPETVIAIGNYAFENCYNLDSITIPGSITSVGISAFEECYNLERVYTGDVESWLKIDFNDYDSTPMYYADELYFGGQLVTDIVIPEGTTKIYDYAFSRCEGLTSVVIPDSVKSIGEYAFGSCVNLKNVTLGKGITEIRDSFKYCSSLESIIIPYNVKSIKSSAFSQCTSLKDIYIYNPECEFATECGFNLNQNIYGVPGSTAEAFADQIGADFFDIATVHTHQFTEQEVRGYCSYKLCSCGTPEYVLHTDSNYDAVCDSCKKSTNDIEIGETITLYLIDDEDYYLGYTATQEGNYILTVEGDYYGINMWACMEDKESPAELWHEGNNLIVRIRPGHKIYWCIRPLHDNADGGDVKFTLTYTPSHNCSFTSTVTKQPTCTEPGIRTCTCTCGASYTNSIPANGHSYGAWYISKLGSCKDGTVIKRDCSKCTVKDTISLGTTGDHKAETIISRATDTHDGTIIKRCSVCGEKISTTSVAKIASVTLSATKYAYNGKAQTPAVTVKDSKGKALKKDTDYTVTYSSGRKSIGKYTVTVKFKGNYGGTERLSFTIVPATVSGVKAATVSTSSVKLTWKAVSGATNYRVYQYDSGKKKYVSVAFVSGTSYTVSSLKAATTYKFKVRAYTELSDDSFLCGSLSSEVSGTTSPAKVTLSTVTAGSKQATLTWKTVIGASGYQVQYSTSSKFKSAKTATVSGSSSKKTTIKKLTKGKKYYFKVRAYKTVGSTKVYGAWSSVKNVKVK